MSTSDTYIVDSKPVEICYRFMVLNDLESIKVEPDDYTPIPERERKYKNC